MINFFIKCILLLSLLFVTVLFGMQQANNGIRDMKGYNDPNFKGAFQLTEGSSGDLEAAFLGERVTSHDLQEKQEKLQSMEAFNLFSSIGKKFADGIAYVLQVILDWLSNLIFKLTGNDS
jgi:hypothetical protein